MTKFKDEMERIEKEAHLQAATTKPSGGEIYAHYWAQGVEEALIWAAGKGTSDRMRELEFAADAADAEQERQQEPIDRDTIREQRDRFAPGTESYVALDTLLDLDA